MHVGIDQEAYLAGRDAPHGVDQPLGQRREQRIDEQHAVGSGKDADIAASARALQHVDVARHGHGRQLDARELSAPGLFSRGDDDHDASRRQRGGGDTGVSGHTLAPGARHVS